MNLVAIAAVEVVEAAEVVEKKAATEVGTATIAAAVEMEVDEAMELAAAEVMMRTLNAEEWRVEVGDMVKVMMAIKVEVVEMVRLVSEMILVTLRLNGECGGNYPPPVSSYGAPPPSYGSDNVVPPPSSYASGINLALTPPKSSWLSFTNTSSSPSPVPSPRSTRKSTYPPSQSLLADGAVVKVFKSLNELPAIQL